MSLSKLTETSFDAEEKIWRAQKSPNSKNIFNVYIGLGRLVMEVLKTTPERITQVSADNGAEMTCYEMRVRTIKIANYLIKRGYKQSDIAGVIALNSENLASAVFACLILGMPINILIPIMSESEIIEMYSKTNPKVIFCDVDILEKVEKAVKTIGHECEIITMRGKDAKWKFIDDLMNTNNICLNEFTYPELDDIADSTAFIICSSGSTGKYKLMNKSHRQFINHHTDRHFIPSNEQIISFNFSPLFWITGLYFLIAGSLYGSKRVITTKPPTPINLTEIVNEFQVDTSLLSTSMLSAFIASSSLNDNEKTMKSMKLMILGGSHISKSLQVSAQKYMPNAKLVVVYATSEFDLCSDTLEMDREGSVGQLFGYNEAIIIDDEDNKLGPNQTGEICLRVQTPFLGYFGDPELTKNSYIEEYFKTSDVGYFDDDCFLYISGRKKEMIRYNGALVSQTEIEDLINLLEGVAGSCVVGVSDGKSKNEAILAFVLKKLNITNSISDQEIIEYVNSKVTVSKKITAGVHFIETILKTPSGKVRRVEMKNIAQKIFDKKQCE